MGARSPNITTKQMLPLFRVISDLEQPCGSTTSLQTNASNLHLENSSVLGHDDIIIHQYCQSDHHSSEDFFPGVDSHSDKNQCQSAHGRNCGPGYSLNKRLSKTRNKKRRRLKMHEGIPDFDFQFKGKKVVDKRRVPHRHRDKKNRHRIQQHSSNREEQHTSDLSNQSHNNFGSKRTGLFTEMGLSMYKEDGVDISRHFKDLAREEYQVETDNVPPLDQSDCPTYEVPKDVIRNHHKKRRKKKDRQSDGDASDMVSEHFEDSAGNTARVVRSKTSTRKIVQKYEDMLNVLMEKCQQKDDLIQEKDSNIAKMKSKIKELFSVNNQFADENEYMKRQHEDMKHCIEQYKIFVGTIEDQLRKREDELNVSKGICTNCNTNEIAAIKMEKKQVTMLEDLVMLKNVVYRLNVQLSRYQDKLRNAHPSLSAKLGDGNKDEMRNVTSEMYEGLQLPVLDEEEGISIPPLPKFNNNPDDKTDTQDSKMNSNVGASDKRTNFAKQIQMTYSVEYDGRTAWGDVNSHTLAPLLNSYQESIVEKDQLIRDYEAEFNRFTSKLKLVVEENDSIHEAASRLAAELAATKERCGLAVGERDTLRREGEDMREKLDQLGEKLKQVHEIYEQKLEMMSRDYATMHSEYVKCKGALSAARARCQMLEEQCKSHSDGGAIPSAVHNSRIEECKRLFEDLKSRYESEKERGNARLIVLQQNTEQLEKKIVELMCEKQKLESKLKASDRVIKRFRKDTTLLKGEVIAARTSRDVARRRSNHATFLCRQMAAQLQGAGGATPAGTQSQKAKSEKMLVQKEMMKELDAVETKMLEQDKNLESIKKESTTEIAKLEDMLRESKATIEAMRQHIYKERLKKYGPLKSDPHTTLPDDVARMRLTTGKNENFGRASSAVQLPSANIIPVKGGYFIHKDKNRPAT